jgi:2-polyprenyl-6-methoxyphenol hydroxylase-like FAD-dependent oxidoreductase
MLKRPVAIVGGGPVGVVLAPFLDRYGIESVLFNTGHSTYPYPRGSTHNSRTMKHYRTLGLSQDIRSLGLPPSHSRDISYMTRLNGCELARIHMGSEEERKRASLIAADNDQMVEPLFRSNQMYVERYLLKQVRLRPRITLRFGCTVTDFSQDAHGVVVQSHNAEGDLETWNASYLMGCDGGQSVVRRTLGIDYQGPDGAIGTGFMTGQMISTHVRVEGLTSGLLQGREAWLYNILNQDHRVLLFSLNGQDDFVMMSKRDCKIGEGTGMLLEQLRSSFGVDIPCTLLSSSAWTGGHALVAEGFRIGRVFLAGDAAHLFSPTDGLGMNTGIDDVANLAWKLAAVVQGWGGENLIHTYETERRPIAVRNTSAARDLSRRIGEVVIH